MLNYLPTQVLVNGTGIDQSVPFPRQYVTVPDSDISIIGAIQVICACAVNGR